MSRAGDDVAAATVTDDEWQAHTTREAALAIGRWLEARGNLHLPIRTFRIADLEAIANAAVHRWIVLNSHRLQERPASSDQLKWLLAG